MQHLRIMQNVEVRKKGNKKHLNSVLKNIEGSKKRKGKRLDQNDKINCLIKNPKIQGN